MVLGPQPVPRGPATPSALSRCAISRGDRPAPNAYSVKMRKTTAACSGRRHRPATADQLAVVAGLAHHPIAVGITAARLAVLDPSPKDTRRVLSARSLR